MTWKLKRGLAVVGMLIWSSSTALTQAQQQGQSNTGRVNIVIDTGVATEIAGDSTYPVRRLVTTTGYDSKRLKIEIRATSAPGNINIASLPAAPLSR